ncbi:14937_t:CDS:10 [Funneliformis caledonium]|uniref:14937_t:CDS:1 n=1 Tax=Funneliformis caledonium TaxID=1117310 RepID=A0A9N9GWF0_9GLOM|nr:14937_t:CDS:10 [Funneliformis caledonium]
MDSSDSESSDFDLQLETLGENSNDISETIHNLLEQLSSNLYQYDTHVQYIHALRQAALYDELKEARELMHSIFPLSEEMWREWIEDESRIASTKEEKHRVIHLYGKAVEDYLSINLWKDYTSYVVQEYKSGLNEMQVDKDESDCVVTLDQVRKIFEEANREICYYITESHQIWDAYRDFEVEILEASPRDDEQKSRVRKMYESRLKIPHATIDKTFSDYSTFITQYDNLHYESVMIETNKYVSESKDKYYQRDRYENALKASGNALDKFMDYIEFEKKQKKQIVNAIRTLYERAIAIYYLEYSLWEDYMLYLIDKNLTDKKVSLSILIKTAERSVRNCSWSGDLWSHYIRLLEKNFSSEEIVNVYNRALSTGMLKNNIDDLIKLVISYVDYERRQILTYQGSMSQVNSSNLVNLLEEGIKTVKEIFQTGDPHYRLEKYLIEIETLIKDLPKARQVWENLIKDHRNESEFWIRYADWEKTAENIIDARRIYKKASQQNTDWPERIFDAWEQFEHQYGTVDHLELAVICIKKQMKIVAQRREKALKEVQKVQNEGSTKITPAMQIDESLQTIDHLSSEQNSSEAKKRKSEENEQQLPSAKRNKAQQFEKPKRDREFATVAVSNLPLGVKEGELKNLFHECGGIKDIRILEDASSTHKTAYVEFNERESVPAALTKDKKKIGEQEISVYTLSERILYVTNIPPSADVKELFKEYGEIISVRLPNSKYRKGRFCYVEFKERESAQAALEKDGYELEPGKKISVMISNPLLKKERSPPIQTEVLIHVRMPKTPDKKCKGVAFVEFKNKEDAKASLGLNSTEFKGYVLSVSLSVIDRNRGQKEGTANEKKKEVKRKQEEVKESEKRSRTVTFTKLPKDTSEDDIRDMLSQIFKDEEFRKITMAPDSGSAHVEFENVEDTGKAELHFNKYKLNNTIISATVRNDLPSTLTELAVRREGKPTSMTMVPRRLVAPSSKLGKTRRPGVPGLKSGQRSSSKEQTAEVTNASSENQMEIEVGMEDNNTSKKSNEDFRELFYKGK